MNPRRARFAFRLTTIVCTAAIPVAIVAGFLVPRAAPIELPRSTIRSRPSPTTGSAGAPSPDAYGTALDRAWRPSLGEAPPGAVVASSAPAVQDAALAHRLTLVGTVGESVALIRGPDGTVALVEVGDDVEGADVVAIRTQQVDLRQGGRLVRLQKALPAPESRDIIVR